MTTNQADKTTRRFGDFLKQDYATEPNIAAWFTPKKQEQFGKFLEAIYGPPRTLKLDYLAARAIRYELADPHRPERLRELELATARSCGEWYARTRPREEMYVRPGSEDG